MIIGLSGYIGSGKDTIGEIIQKLTIPKPYKHVEDEFGGNLTDGRGNYILQEEKSKWQIKKFAYKLKQIASILTGIPQEKFEDQEFKKTELSSEWNWGDFEDEIRPMTIRTFLQRLGTDAIRDGLHPNTWVNALFADYKGEWDGKLSNVSKEIYPNWIITDVRFPNEAKAIKERRGFVVRINRNVKKIGDQEVYIEPNPINLHPSETSLNNWEFDYLINNNSTIEELTDKVKLMLNVMNIT